MKPFDLEAAKNGAPVVTRDGRKARIVCFDRDMPRYPLVVLINTKDCEGILTSATKTGCHTFEGVEAPVDLFMAPVKREGWINLYRTTDGGVATVGPVHKSYAAAVGNSTEKSLVATIRIEWEE